MVDPLARDERHRHFGALLEYSPDAIVIVDAAGLAREWNPAAEPLLHTAVSLVVNAPLRELLSEPLRDLFDDAWAQMLDGKAAPRASARGGVDAGEAPRLDVTVAPIRASGSLVGAVVILRDAASHRLRLPVPVEASEDPPDGGWQMTPGSAEFDGPSGLPGRDWLQRRLSQPHAPEVGRGVAVFDIDAFDRLTVSYGTDAADGVVARFGALLRSLGTPGVFARWREDSFLWIVDSTDPVAALDDCVSRLRTALEGPFQVGEDRGWLTVSIGLAASTLVVGGDLVEAATDALKAAKEAGGGAALYYDETMEKSATSAFRMASDLRFAIEHDELRLHYQPIMDFATNEIAGVEALVRWERPGVGLLAPGAFIDAAERNGQIVPLGNWVVRTACRNASVLGSHSGGPRTMSINVSAGQLRDPGLITTLREAMVEGKCPPSSIVIEVTESVLLDDLSMIAASLNAIKDLDIGLDLDDFGTGYSSLQYLRNLPIDRLKVDQGFVAGLGTNGADTAIVASTIALAHALGLRSIAEGVETVEQLALLREMGCDFAQGYLLSRPTDMDTFVAWLEAYVPAEVFPAVSPTAAERTLRSEGAADRRVKRADRRDVKADRRDLKSATRDTKANNRDATATTRDSEANARDTEANTRDLTANTRDMEANTRDMTADGREQTADERERVADLRDAVAAEREHVEDDRQREREAGGSHHSGGGSNAARRTASQDRSRATAARLVEASDRARAGKGRDVASAERANGAVSESGDHADSSPHDGDAQT